MSSPIRWIPADGVFKSDAPVTMDPVLRILLMSDGSTTTLLQALWLTPVEVHVIRQREISLDASPAEFLTVEPGTKALAREAWLSTKGQRRVYASSMMLLDALPRALLKGVSDGRKPLGLLFSEAGLPIVRDGLQVASFSDPAGRPFWMRRYRMSLGHRSGPRPFAAILEQFIGVPLYP